jgi:hypothetical protein
LPLLLGYLAFVCLSVIHVHSYSIGASSNNYSFIADNDGVKTVSNSEDDCQVCHLFFSINVNSVPASALAVFSSEQKFLVANESAHFLQVDNQLCLRGPPFNKTLFV